MCFVGGLLVFVFGLKFEVLVPELLQLVLLGVDFGLELLLTRVVVLDESVVQLLVFLTDLLNFLLLVIFDLADLALEFIDLLLLLLRMSGPLLPQVDQLGLAVGLCLLQTLDFGLEVLDHLGVRVLLLRRRCQHLLHYDFVV